LEGVCTFTDTDQGVHRFYGPRGEAHGRADGEDKVREALVQQHADRSVLVLIHDGKILAALAIEVRDHRVAGAVARQVGNC
jgi:hypothetical protein